MNRLAQPLLLHCPAYTCNGTEQIVASDGSRLATKSPHAGFIFKLSTPDSTTQMEESFSEGLCMLDQKSPGDVFVPLEETSR